MKSLLKCPLCQNIFIEPVDCESCAGTLCRNCRFETKNSNSSKKELYNKVKCSLCCKKSSCKHNLTIQSFIKLLKFNCKNKESGCNLEFSYSEINSHEQNCEFMSRDEFKSKLIELKRENSYLKGENSSYKSENFN